MPNSREAVKESPGGSAQLLLVSRSSPVRANIVGREGLLVTDDLRSRPGGLVVGLAVDTVGQLIARKKKENTNVQRVQRICDAR